MKELLLALFVLLLAGCTLPNQAGDSAACSAPRLVADPTQVRPGESTSITASVVLCAPASAAEPGPCKNDGITVVVGNHHLPLFTGESPFEPPAYPCPTSSSSVLSPAGSAFSWKARWNGTWRTASDAPPQDVAPGVYLLTVTIGAESATTNVTILPRA